MGTLKAPKYQARNSATGDLLRENGEVVTGTYTWVASAVIRLISEGNRPAFVMERVPGHCADEDV